MHFIHHISDHFEMLTGSTEFIIHYEYNHLIMLLFILLQISINDFSCKRKRKSSFCSSTAMLILNCSTNAVQPPPCPARYKFRKSEVSSETILSLNCSLIRKSKRFCLPVSIIENKTSISCLDKGRKIICDPNVRISANTDVNFVP